MLVDCGYSGIKTEKQKRSTKKQNHVAADKDRKIQELRTRVEELERECELLRGKVGDAELHIKSPVVFLWSGLVSHE